jgi:putative acetyltransferase
MVRLATSFDASAIATLFHETVKKVNARDYDVKQIAAWAGAAPDVAKWRARQAGRTTLVFEVGGTVRGFAEFAANGQVEAIYVHADHQRKGIASALLLQMEEDARRLGVARLFTEASTTARSFFQKRGFKVLKQQEVDYQGSSFTNFRMAKSLL